MAAQAWNPRYLAYATAHGETPDRMRERDRQQWRGGRAVGFILWNGQMWSDWSARLGLRPTHARGVSEAEIAENTAWLPLGDWLRRRATVSPRPHT